MTLPEHALPGDLEGSYQDFKKFSVAVAHHGGEFLGDTRDAFFQGFFSEKFFKAISSLREALPYLPSPFSTDGKK
eukprot:CAMPEP_0119053822 /NCGR_PEP_ID=MMETSP1177-20130426/74671_1 /TAXON_ID=2985 /ORGANISM="Ochromonas sp, Strain CCMP1899" /LENGTH=74 /DNA_ID=CAMNT_0007033877 /DNA_START=1243 /DNA_END=1467 /DNA_ORIENTATION=-